MDNMGESWTGEVMKSSRPMWTKGILERWSMLSGVRCGIEPLDEVAMNVGNGRDHVNDFIPRANSDSEREHVDVSFFSMKPLTADVAAAAWFVDIVLE